ncbi:MAG: HAD family phosphatase [Candidatus Aenigmarchaeota archaeon]|nr:HAD family phosphatase [Candidatus Aenigmarchaeota archaeon]
MPQIRAIIFDVGGVVVKTEWDKFFRKYVKHSRMPASRLQSELIESPVWRECYKGKFSEADVWKRLERDSGIDKETIGQVKRNWKKVFEIDDEVAKVVKAIRKKYEVFALTNVCRESASYIEKMGVYKMFDGVVISCEIGMVKPEQEIYHHILREFRLAPGECVFIDNLEQNLPPATSIGIRTVKFDSVPQLKRALKKLGVKI